jgi:hypothetical protein
MAATSDPRLNNAACVFDKPPYTHVPEHLVKRQQEMEKEIMDLIDRN